MGPQKKPSRLKKLPSRNKATPLTMERLVPLFENLKDFVRASIKSSLTASENALRQEMHTLHYSLKTDIRTINDKIDVIHCALTEHTKGLKTVTTTVDDHEVRLTHLEQQAP